MMSKLLSDELTLKLYVAREISHFLMVVKLTSASRIVARRFLHSW